MKTPNRLDPLVILKRLHAYLTPGPDRAPPVPLLDVEDCITFLEKERRVFEVSLDELAREAFNAYNAHAGGKTWDGKPTPPWEKLGEAVQGHWRAGVMVASKRLSVLGTPKDCPACGGDGQVCPTCKKGVAHGCECAPGDAFDVEPDPLNCEACGGKGEVAA